MGGYRTPAHPEKDWELVAFETYLAERIAHQDLERIVGRLMPFSALSDAKVGDTGNAS